jgi:cytochrome oxidase Cu insertion factor (SCO1/SenC/PrrC family)
MPALFRYLFIAGLVLIVGVMLVGAILPKAPPAAEGPSAFAPPQPTGLVQKGPAPAIELTSVDGEKFSLASLQGKAPVVLFFFATW